MKYSPQVKEAVLKRILDPKNSTTVAATSREFGIPYQTIILWKNQAMKNGVSYEFVGSESNADGEYSTHDKFIMVVETMGMTETELGEYVRSKGIYAEDLEQWRKDCENAPGTKISDTAQLHRTIKDLTRKVNALAKDLELKNKALAEYAALDILRKKSLTIWEEEKEE